MTNIDDKLIVSEQKRPRKIGRPRGTFKKRKRYEDGELLTGTAPPLRIIAQKYGLTTREGARYRLKQDGVYKIWKRDRQHYQQNKAREVKLRGKEKKQELSHIVGMVQCIGYVDSMVAQKTAEFFRNNPISRQPHDRLVRIFTRYFKALVNGQKLSLVEVAGEDIKKEETMLRIIRSVDLEPMYGTHQKVTLEQKEALRKAFLLDMTMGDIAYFLDLTYASVKKNFERMGKRPLVKRIFVGYSYLKPRRSLLILPCRTASRIYSIEDQNLGFSDAAIGEYLEIPGRMVNYARDNRKTIEFKIIHALRMMYPDRDIKKPYLKKE